jgi:hypothetical protein
MKSFKGLLLIGAQVESLPARPAAQAAACVK